MEPPPHCIVGLKIADSIPEGIAVDPEAGLLFFADRGRGTINLLTLRHRQRKVIVQNMRFPRTVRIDPIYRWVSGLNARSNGCLASTFLIHCD